MWAHQFPSDPCSDFNSSQGLSDRFVRATTAIFVRIDGTAVDQLFDHFEATPRFFKAIAPWTAGGRPVIPQRPVAGLVSQAASGSCSSH
jgi:hypothetical protein